MNKYGYTPEGKAVVRPLAARSLRAAVNEARAEIWDTRSLVDRARLYRNAGGWRFVGFVTYDGRFVDQRVSR